MRKIYNFVIKITERKFERVLTFWFIIFAIMALLVWVIEAVLGVSHDPQWYDIVYMVGCVYGYFGTLKRLSEVI